MALLPGLLRGTRPDPAPLELHDTHVVLVGTLLWAAGLVVLVLADLLGVSVPGWQPLMCLTGIALGVAGLRVMALRTQRRRRRR